MKKNIASIVILVTVFISTMLIPYANARPSEISITIEPENPELLKAILEEPIEDEKLLSDVVQFLEKHNIKIWENNAHVYLWGFDIQSDNTYEAGLFISKNLAKAFDEYDYKNPFDESFLTKYEKIDLPEQKLCSLQEFECNQNILELINSKPFESEKLNSFLKKYDTFLSFPIYHSNALPPMDDTFRIPSYRHLLLGNKLKNLYWLNELKSGNKMTVLSLIDQQAMTIRSFLRQANTVIDKMVMNQLFSEHLALINIARHFKWLNAKEISGMSSLKSLTIEENATELAWSYEEKIRLSMIQKTVKPENGESPLINLFYSDLPKQMIKPNAIINKLYIDFFLPLQAYRKQSPKSFYEGLENFDIEINFDEVTHSAGSLINADSTQVKDQFLTFQTRIFATNMKIQLLKALAKEGSADQIIDAAKQGKNEYLSHYDNSLPVIGDYYICYKGILDERVEDRCLLHY